MRTLLSRVVLLIGLFALPWRVAVAADDVLARYNYQETRQLVALVEDAAALIEQQGEQAFVSFGQKNSRWWNKDLYLFVYTANGTNVFHAAEPALTGRNLMSFTDSNGKPVGKMLAEIGAKPEGDARGWMFYLWEYHTQLMPMWKTAYVRKAISPEGTTFLVGSGLYTTKVERAFVQDRVELACDMLRSKGRAAAFAAFRDAASPFVFLGSYIFVLDADGHTVVDPAYPNMAGRDLSDLTDVVGMKVVAELKDKLAQSDDAWVQYLWPRPGGAATARKLIYARKVTMDGQTLLVGSDFYLPTPIWMRP